MLKVDEIDVYYGDAQALAGVSLEVEDGQIVALLGANGAGKSTTLRAISGILRPRSGRIMLNGVRLDQLPAHEVVRCGVAHVPEGRRLFPQMTVEENLIMGAFYPAAWKRREESLARVYDLFPRLKERSRQLAGTLSGGEQQMCAIGRALMGQPRLLMLDEPSLGLAPNIVEKIFEVIQEINDQGVTILLVEQNAHLALQTAHVGYVLENGRVVRHGAARELLGDNYVRQAYLGL